MDDPLSWLGVIIPDRIHYPKDFDMEPLISVETITPDIAREMLEKNINNRNLRKARVQQYAVDMAEGRWQVTGEAIKFNGSALIDGQHRLAACVKAEASFRTLVVRQLPEGVNDVLDQGMPRSIADVLHWHGGKSGTQVAAAARALLVLKSGHPPVAGSQVSGYGITRQVITDFALANHERLSEMINFSRRNDFGANHTAVAVFLFLVGDLLDDETPEEFIATTASGAQLNEGDPRLALRNWMVKSGGALRRSTTLPDHLAVVIRAWGAYVEGRKVKMIRSWIRSQPFPEIELP